MNDKENFNNKLYKWKNNFFTKDIEIKETYSGNAMITEVYGVRGFLTPGDILFLWDVGLNLPKDGKYLEVGSWQGLSGIVVSFGLISNLNFNARVYCVDPWEVMPEQNMFLEEVKERQLYEIFLNNIEKTKMKKFISPLRGKSLDIAKDMENELFDTIFIDGEHTYESCYSDLNAWYPKLKKGGRLIGHDASSGNGVEKAVKQFTSENKLKYTIINPPYSEFIWEIVF